MPRPESDGFCAKTARQIWANIGDRGTPYRSLGDIFGFIIFWNSAFLELQRRVSKGRIRKMTNLRICTVGLDHNWWFLTTFLMFCLWFSWFIAPETDSKKITKIIGILPNALELGCQKLSKKCTGINLRGKAGSRTNPEVFKIHRCLCFRVCMGQCCQRLVIKFLSRGVSLLLAAYHSQKLAQKAVGRGPSATTMSFHGDFPWFDRRRAGCDSETHLVLNNSSGVCYNGWQHAISLLRWSRFWFILYSCVVPYVKFQ